MLSFDFKNSNVGRDELGVYIDGNIKIINNVLSYDNKDYINYIGWKNIDNWANKIQLTDIRNIANEIRENADVFILIGIGGSNQGARATIKALQTKADKVEILYAGNNLNGHYLYDLLESIENKSVYVNVIAKNFATLEPGISFRIIRQWMEQKYGLDEAAKRIIATCSHNNCTLHLLSETKGYRTIHFPLDVGGRYSVLTPVGLLPIAVAGVGIGKMIRGAKDISYKLQRVNVKDNPVVQYASIRNMLHLKGYNIEILSNFDTRLEYFMKWWLQLFAESEGKDNKGIFPSICNFSEDLHSMGQYIQDGQKNIFETFLNVENTVNDITISDEKDNIDLFSYLDGKTFHDLNTAAYEATLTAHSQGGVPCMAINIPEISEYYFGQLFYFFMMSCYLSGELLCVNPFNQPGVEAYKNHMFEKLGKEKE